MFEILNLKKSKPREKLIEIEVYLPRIEFPLSRNKMLEYAEREFVDRDAFLLNIFQSLDTEVYETKESLEHDLTFVFNTSRKDFFGKNQSVESFTIYTTKDELHSEKGEHLRQEKMNVGK